MLSSDPAGVVTLCQLAGVGGGHRPLKSRQLAQQPHLDVAEDGRNGPHPKGKAAVAAWLDARLSGRPYDLRQGAGRM